ncbi:hypothetical protein BGW36DRAFT_28351 [Talaromyces proteolyticus]|uniref:Uncharacterized protein n=1 Tax=Talaromyces proteolyticus TaxID=1131652 RepID=A0AAD4KJP9_9EURO|nr:uncharacterized protein BGW36DRAFT_28351 [Talaromyces proteolyticus]KAH8692831.1 hypothetical protein BGW36DRAFT_28351 [Talaromyces proteolyticus]
MSRLLSPPSEEDRPAFISGEFVHMQDPIRTAAIHKKIPEIRVPEGPLPSSNYDPRSCKPIDIQAYRPQIQQLRKEYPTTKANIKAQEEAARQVRRKLQEIDDKIRQVTKEKNKKKKEWDMEYKVLSKYQANKPPK